MTDNLALKKKTQNMKPLHIYALQLLTVRHGTIFYSVGGYHNVHFPPGKELALLEKSNQLSSEIYDFLGLYIVWNGNSYHHCPA